MQLAGVLVVLDDLPAGILVLGLQLARLEPEREGHAAGVIGAVHGADDQVVAARGGLFLHLAHQHLRTGRLQEHQHDGREHEVVRTIEVQRTHIVEVHLADVDVIVQPFGFGNAAQVGQTVRVPVPGVHGKAPLCQIERVASVAAAHVQCTPHLHLWCGLDHFGVRAGQLVALGEVVGRLAEKVHLAFDIGRHRHDLVPLLRLQPRRLVFGIEGEALGDLAIVGEHDEFHRAFQDFQLCPGAHLGVVRLLQPLRDILVMPHGHALVDDQFFAHDIPDERGQYRKQTGHGRTCLQQLLIPGLMLARPVGFFGDVAGSGASVRVSPEYRCCPGQANQAVFTSIFFSSSSAARMPRALPASGLSPVSSRRRGCENAPSCGRRVHVRMNGQG